MILRKVLVRIMMGMGLLTGNASCATPAAIPPADTVVPACETDKVTISDLGWFRDAVGAWRVVGVINNHSTRAISKVFTAVEAKTADGQPTGRGEDVSAYPLNLQPGAQAPFTAWIDRAFPGLDHFEVVVEECVLAEQAERAQVEVRGGRMALDGRGLAQVTAELYNPGPESVLINGLMAAAYDQAGGLIAADYVVVSTRSLGPGESGPVRAVLNLPPEGATKIKSYRFFMDVLVNHPARLPLDVKHDVQVVSRYTDQEGRFHLVGQLTNPGKQWLMTSLQATVYIDPDSSVVADAACLNTWIPLGPGESLPFDLSDWGVLSSTPGLWEQMAGQNAAIALRLEPFLTWTTEARVAKLPLVESNASFTESQAYFSGEVKNNTGSGINNCLVIIVLRLKRSGEMVATGSVHLGIVDSATPEQILDYQLVIPMPPDVDPAALTVDIMALGQQP
jgi:hypothetical protein